MYNYVPGLVSIVMPSYNTGKFILETILSVQRQTYTNWEIILVDDCSNDNTLELLSKIEDSRIRIYVNDKNSGAAVSRNRALREARGEWIAFLDSDDLWTSDKLEKQLDFMITNNYKFTCAYCSYIDEDSNLLGKIDTSPSIISSLDMLFYNWIGCLTVIYHYPSIGLVQIEDIEKRNDYALWLKIIKKEKCYCLKEVLGQYRIRKFSISHTSYLELIKSHYILFRRCDNRNIICSIVLTFFNIIFAIIRKVIFVKSIKHEIQNGY